MRAWFVFISLFCFGFTATAATSWLSFNSSEVKKAIATEASADNLSATLSARPTKQTLEEVEMSQKRALATAPNDPKVKSDYAGFLIFKYGASSAENALGMLEQVESEAPGLYSTAINRATALELIGRFDEATEWIEEARRRNPQPQAGTEWLQQLIIQGKKEFKADPQWLIENSVLGADFGNELVPKWPRIADVTTWSKRSRQALLFQLRDRVPNAKKPDPILADLIFDFGTLQLLSGSPATAAQLYELAITFGLAKKSLAEMRLKQLKSQTPAAPLESRWNQLVLILLLLIAAAGFFNLYLKRRKRPVDTENNG